MGKRRGVKLSVIAPAYNEEDNIIHLVEAFDDLRRKVNFGIELIIVDDGSTDRTAERARSVQKHFNFVKVVSYSFNRGKTFAVQRGLDIAQGKYIVIFDADLQFDPNDLPPMVEKLDRGADLVAGYKVGKYQKPIVSKIYNLLGRILFKVPVRDMNALKAMRREVLETVPFRPDWHRYIVIWAHKNGFKLVEHPVTLRPRMRGVSKYRGFGRILVGTFDMLSVWFQLTFAQRPMLFFGTAGILTFALAFALGIVAIVLRYGYGIGFRPLLTLIAMLANIGVVMFIGGFIGEMIEGLKSRVERTTMPYAKKPETTTQQATPAQTKSRRQRSKNAAESQRETGGSSEAQLKPIKRDTKEEKAEQIPEEKNEKEEKTEPQISWGRRTKKGGRR